MGYEAVGFIHLAKDWVNWRRGFHRLWYQGPAQTVTHSLCPLPKITSSHGSLRHRLAVTFKFGIYARRNMLKR